MQHMATWQRSWFSVSHHGDPWDVRMFLFTLRALIPENCSEKIVGKYTLGCPPSQDASGKWRFRLGFPTKNGS